MTRENMEKHEAIYRHQPEIIAFWRNIKKDMINSLKMAGNSRECHKKRRLQFQSCRLEWNRGRDAHYWAPPAQNRTCPIKAYGSHLG